MTDVPKGRPLRFISWDDIHAHLDYLRIVEALDEMFRTGTAIAERMILSQPTADGGTADSLIQPAWIPGSHLGIKIANVFPGNAARGLPTVLGSYLLFDGTTGEPLAYIDGAALTLVKTACNSALAARYLARAGSTTLLMMGAGSLAPYLIEAHCTVRPIDRVLIWNRTPAKAEALAARLERPGRRATAILDRAAAAAEADIVSCATFAARPILEGAWLRPGVHVDLVGSYTPALREADDEVMRRATRVIIDARLSTLEVSGDLIGPIRAGILDPSAVADMTELASGRRPGRTSDADITVFKSGGGGHEDLATARAIYRIVDEGGVNGA